jgi:hypothetical protein
MKQNLGNLDRLLRIIFAAAITVLFFSRIITGILGLVLLGIAIIFLGTSLFGYCLLYSLFGFNTRKKISKEFNLE